MHWNIRLWQCAFCLLLFVYPSKTLAGVTGLRSYFLPDHGSMQFQVPADWEDRISQPPYRLPPTIEFMPKNGEPFKMLITPMWPANDKIKLPDGEALRKTVRKSAEQIRSQAVEKTIVVKELIGSSAYGYYFSATDPAPKPGEFKYMTQGHVRAGQLMLIFTLLTNDGQESIISDGLALMKSVNLNKPETFSQLYSIEIVDAKGVFNLTVPMSRLVLTIPKGNLSLVENSLGGSTDNPRYFFFRDDTLKLNISGWLEPAQAFGGVKKHWEKETASWRRQGLPEPQNILYEKFANWDIVIYDIILSPDSTSFSHIKAHWLQRGTWIEVHISVACDAPSEETRTKLLALLGTFRVTEKK